MVSPSPHTDQMESHASYAADHTHIGAIRMRDVKLRAHWRGERSYILYNDVPPACTLLEFARENIHIL